MKRLINIQIVVLILLNLQVVQQAFPQVEQPSRFEVEVEWQDEYFNIISAEENGLFLVRKNVEKSQKADIVWEITILDTALTVRWNKDIYLNFNF